MCQVVRQSRFQDGSEIDVRFTVYLTNYEAMSLIALLRKEFGDVIPFDLDPSHYLAVHRIKDSLERSL